MGAQAWARVPKVKPREEGHGVQKFRGIGVGHFQSPRPGQTGEAAWEQMHIPWDLLGHLRQIQRSGKFTRSLSLFSLTDEEQDNTGSSWQGSSSFKPATLGLGGLSSPRPGWAGNGEPGQLSGWNRSLCSRGLSSKGRSRTGHTLAAK